jgi:beta-glucuronidase
MNDLICDLQRGGATVMPVPSSFNDITQERAIRDHIGWVWYETYFTPPASMQTERVMLRFGSVHYHAEVVSAFTD